MGIQGSYWATGGILAVLGLIVGRAILALLAPLAAWAGGLVLVAGAFLLKAMLALAAVLALWAALRFARTRRRARTARQESAAA